MTFAASLLSAHEQRPVSVLYGGAHRFSRKTPAKIQRIARAAFEEFFKDSEQLASHLGLQGDDAFLEAVYERVGRKLVKQPLEDLRIDFEDGLGAIARDELLALAAHCGAELAAISEGDKPPHAGFRCPEIDEDHRARAFDVSRAFLESYVQAGGKEPCIITLPKVEDAEDVRRFVDELESIEDATQAEHPCPIEIMVESPRGLMVHGHGRVHELIDAGRGRVTSVHLGSYDYAASLGITGRHQQPEHPSVDFARQLLIIFTRERSVGLSDGALHQLPLAVHRGSDITAEQEKENLETMHRGWRRHAQLISHALGSGLRQGWDLHPHQLISRYAATFAFYRDGLDRIIERAAAFRSNEGRGIRTAADWDDNASYRGLFLHLLLGHLCGAVTDEELQRAGFEIEA